MSDIRICNCCGKSGVISDDQTDPGADEMVIDSQGLICPNLYVCGACLADAEEDAVRTPKSQR